MASPMQYKSRRSGPEFNRQNTQPCIYLIASPDDSCSPSRFAPAANQIDLAEGTILKPGESATASLYCAVPKEQWNTDTYWGAANWTMNTNDPNWDKQYIAYFLAI